MNDKLIEAIFNKFPSAQYASGKTEIMMKCPFCGDTHTRSKHFYISIKDGEPHFYNCFKCGVKGILSSSTLRELQIYDIDLSQELNNYNKTLKVKTRTYKQSAINKFIVNHSYIREDDKSKQKLDYLNNRLGVNLTYADCCKLKIVLNLKDFLSASNIISYTRDNNIIDQLDEHFIGFLSFDNSFVTLRNISNAEDVHNNISHRYIEYNIFNKRDTNRFYCIPTSVNTVDPAPIHIHIAEGAFDILSVFLNLRQANTYQNIYTSMGGKTYLEHIQKFVSTYGFMNAIYHIYIDNDINMRILNDIKTYTKKLNVQVFIHKNIFPNEKDFGVSLDRIKESIKLL